jgi:hypothetical protein
VPNLPTLEAARHLREQHGIRREPRTLQNLRWRGGGPEYLRDIATGEVLYPSERLDEWARTILRPARCTAEERKAAR